MRLICAALFILTSALGAIAADTDSLNTIGFSKAGDYFAFETYGIGDGSGFPYSTIYVVDLKKDAWVGETPIDVTTENEDTSLSGTRAEAGKKAAPILQKLGINQSAELFAANPITEVVDERNKLTFDTIHYSGLEGKPGENSDVRFELALTVFSVGDNADCLSEDGKRQGFALTAKNLASGKSIEVFRDKNIPSSRQCPYQYRIERVVGHNDDKGDLTLVAMITYATQGFEGPDWHFIAVPITLP